MKKTIIALFLVLNICAYAQIETPAPSPGATLTTKIGITDVKITYSRPRIKGRKIFGQGASGEFVTPYGSMWRTGANAGTVITFGDDVEVEGKKVPRGQYLLLTIPGANEWTVILYKDVALGGNTDAYKQENDAARFTIKPEKLAEKVEMFTINVTDLSDDNTTAKIQLAWENTSVKFGVKVPLDSKIMNAIAASNAAAARYYMDTKRDLKQALAWIDSSIATDPNAYWNIYLKAQIQKALGDKAGAAKTSQQSLELAKKDNNNFYVQQNEALLASLK
jgi:hypothetical protein